MKKRLFSALILSVIMALSLAALSACGRKPSLPKVDYSAENDFEAAVNDDENYIVYSPEGAQPTFGLIFYAGTFIAAQNYEYLGKALANKGYLAVFSKTLLAFYQFEEVERAYENYPETRFFVGGHSQGGGAAIRRAAQNPSRTLGLILFAPLCYTLSGGVFNGGNYDESDYYNVAHDNIPAMVLQADGDGVLTAAQKEACSSCVNASKSEIVTLPRACHMSFSMSDSDSTLKLFNDGIGMTEEDKLAQRAETVRRTLAFMNATILQYL